MKPWVLSTLGVCCLVAVAAQGIELEAAGTLATAGKDGTASWYGRFLVGGTNLHGDVEITGIQGVKQARVEGSARGDDVRFTLVGAPMAGYFEGTVHEGKSVRGKFVLGDTKGTWQGTWEPAEGKPAREARWEVQPVPVEPEVPEAMARAADAKPECAILRHPKSMALLSGATRSYILTKCGLQSTREPEVVSLPWWQRGMQRAFEIASDYLPALTDAIAQSFPAAVRIHGSSSGGTSDTFPFLSQRSPSVAAKGSNATHLAAFEDSRQTTARRIAVSKSTNDGSSWVDQGAFSPVGFTGYEAVGGAKLARNYAGDFFLAFQGGAPAQQGPWPYVSKTLNTGTSWRAPVAISTVPGAFSDEVDLAADIRMPGTLPNGGQRPGAGNLYACWTVVSGSGSQIHFARTTQPDLNSPPWTNESIVSDVSTSGKKSACAVAVGAYGHIYVAWWASSPDYNKIEIRSSDDGGLTFGPLNSLGGMGSASARAGSPCQGALGGAPTIDGDIALTPRVSLATNQYDANHVFAVWNSYSGEEGKTEVYFNRSLDFGATWLGTPQVINDVAAQDQFLPKVVSNYYRLQSGEYVRYVKVLWYDRRNDPANLDYQLYEDYSNDYGSTWHGDARWSGMQPVPRLGTNAVDCSAPSCDFSESLGLASLLPNSPNVMATWVNTEQAASGVDCFSNSSSAPNPDIAASVTLPPGGGGGC